MVGLLESMEIQVVSNFNHCNSCCFYWVWYTSNLLLLGSFHKFVLSQAEGGGNRKMGKNAKCGAAWFLLLPDIVRVNKSRMRWVGYVACVWQKTNMFGVLVGKLKERDHLENLGISGRMILNWIIRKEDGRAGTGLIQLRM
jgi:hypothetical protein